MTTCRPPLGGNYWSSKPLVPLLSSERQRQRLGWRECGEAPRMDLLAPHRRQATLFFGDPPPALVRCRQFYNPVQAALIDAHVTLCREDEVFDWTAFEERVASLTQLKLRMEFGRPIRRGDLVFLPVTAGAEHFAALRRTLLSDNTSEPRTMDPHVTVIHPRNGTCTDEAFAEIERSLPPFEWTFNEVALIEQHNGGQWQTLASYSWP